MIKQWEKIIFTVLITSILYFSSVEASDIQYEGTQGTVKWEIDSENILHIAPIEETGTMEDFAEETTSDAWKEYKDQITEVVLEEGVQNISKYAFAGCTNLLEVKIPESVEYVHVSSFLDTKYLKNCIENPMNGFARDDEVALYYDDENKPLGYDISFGYVRLVADDIFIDCDVTGVKSLSFTNDLKVLGYLGIQPESIRFNGYKKQWDEVKKSEKDDFSTAKLEVLSIDNPVLSATDTVDGVILEWEPVYGAEVYKIYRAKNSGESKLIATIEDGSVSSYMDTALLNGVYRYDMSAEGYGAYASSNYAEVIRMTSTSLTLKNDFDGIKVSWKAITPSTGYYLERKCEDGSWEEIAFIEDGTKKTYLDKNVNGGETYTYRIRAFYRGMTGPYSEEAETIRLEYPREITFTNVSNGIKVAWKKVKGAEGYYIFKKVGNGSWKKLATTQNLSYLDKNVNSEKVYSYSIQAYKGEVVSYKGNQDDGVLLESIRRIGLPVITVTNKKDGISIKWKKVQGAEGYYVERKTGDGSWKKIKEIRNEKTVSYLDENVKNGKRYKYRVRTFHFTYSTAKTIEYLKRPTASVKKSGSKLVVSWDKNASGKGYEVQYAQNSSFDKNKKTKTISKASTTKTNITGLKKGKKYYVRVRAYEKIDDKKVYSAWSGYKSITFK